MHREEDGAVHFWRKIFRINSHKAGGGVKRRFQYCTDDSGAIVYLRALQGHSGRNLIDPVLQDNVVIPSIFTMLDVRSIFVLSSTLD